jgi:DNA-binding NarL/FixJ family response regulator
VVVADDSADIRLLLRLRLEQEGYRVLGEATDGVELLALIDRVRPEVILLDVAMPGMDGLEAAALVRQRLPEVKIVILSGYGRERMAADAARAGADAYVEKGASGSELFGVLDTLLAGRAGSRPVDAHPVGDVDVLYRMLLDTLAEGVVLLTAEGIVQAANPAAGELFARPVDRLVGAPWEQLGELTPTADRPTPAPPRCSARCAAATARRASSRSAGPTATSAGWS